MNTKNKIIIGLVILILVVVGGVVLSNNYKQKSNLSEKKTIISEATAIETVKNKFAELKNYPSNQLPPKSIKTEKATDGWYVAFVQEGSGRPIIQAKCFFVGNNMSVAKIGEFNPNINDTTLNISPKTCRAATSSIEKVRTRYESSLMSVPGVAGIGINECNGKSCLKVY